MKDQYIEDYIAKAANPDKLALFKEDVESRNEMFDLGELEDSSKGSPVKIDLHNATTEQLQKAIEVVMKRDKCSWDEAEKLVTSEEA